MELASLQSGWSSFDVIKGILSLAPEGQKNISCSIPVLHSAIYKLKTEDKYSKFFEEYLFEDRVHYKFSRGFQTDIGNLEMSGHLSTVNPDFVDYTIQEKLKNTFQLYTKKRFKTEEFSLLSEMANDFFAQINTHD